MKHIKDLTARAATAYRRNVRTWLTGDCAPVTLSLAPPTAKDLADDGVEVQAWLREWDAWEKAWSSQQDDPSPLHRESKRLGHLGSYDLPRRVVLTTPADIARAAGTTAEWKRIQTRFGRLTAELGADAAEPLVHHFERWRSLPNEDVTRLIAVVDWLRSHDVAHFYEREVPIHGVDGKWLERHRQLTTALAGEHVFKATPRLVYLHFLDTPGPAGLPMLTVPVEDASTLLAPASRLLVVENYVTFLALPPLPGTIAVFGGGFGAGDMLARLVLPATTDVIYWGDLDSHGFAILNQVRAHHPATRSVLMDIETAQRHAALAVEEPRPSTSALTHLTPAEHHCLDWLTEHSSTGCLRIEQERITFDYATAALQALFA